MIMLGILFTLPSGWEMAKGIADYAIPFIWFFITAFWPLWVILIVFTIIRIFFEAWLQSYLRRKRVENDFKQGKNKE